MVPTERPLTRCWKISITLIHLVQHEPHSASASLRLRSGNNFSHGGHRGGGGGPPPPPPPARGPPQQGAAQAGTRGTKHGTPPRVARRVERWWRCPSPRASTPQR